MSRSKPASRRGTGHDAHVLDAGCGRTTRLAAYRHRIAELTGIDLDAEGGVENRTLDRFVVADLCERLPFDDGTFDLVYANFVIEHLAKPAATFVEWRRVLRPAGSLVIVTSNRDSPLLKVGRCCLIERGSRSSGEGPERSSATSFPRSTVPTPRSCSRHCSWTRGSTRSRSPSWPRCTGTQRSYARLTVCYAPLSESFRSSAVRRSLRGSERARMVGPPVTRQPHHRRSPRRRASSAGSAVRLPS